MRRMIINYQAVLLLLLSLMLVSSCLAQDHTLSQSQSLTKTTSDINYDDVEVVRDLYAFHLQVIQPAEQQVWVIAQVIPTLEQSQQVIRRGPLDLPQHGDFRIMLTLAGSPDKVLEKYSWLSHYPIWDVSGYVKRKDAVVNSAFYQGGQGGFVICRINKGVDGVSADGYLRYDPAYLIPAGYQNYVLPASKFCKAHPGLLDDQNPIKSTNPIKNKALLALIHSSNPLLAAAAFRASVATIPLNNLELKNYLEHLQGIQLSLGCYILLTHSLQFQGDNDEGLKLLQSVISSATTSDQLKSILTSVRAAELDLAPYPAGQTITTVLERLKERQTTLNLSK